jgi:tRNA pseudouridine38-40 synthase
LNSEELKKRAPFGKIKLTIEYDGSNYSGWQRQGQGFKSIQQSIEDALSKLLKTDKKIPLIGAGRTDAGVHAINQIAHFIAPRNMERFNLVHAFQALLPPDIVVKQKEIVSPLFHAQNSAKAKTYIYRIWNEPLPSALRARKSLWIRHPLNIQKLTKAAQLLVGTHDFNAFRSEGSFINTTIRTIYAAHFQKVGDYVEFHITGSGFLKQMVRNIVGTLLQTELNGRDPQSIPTLIAARDRKQAGPSVPPQGLYLSEVFYDHEYATRT